MKKLLSIVIPTYNMEELLPRCLDSLINPKCPEFLEILVINDGSKDSSLKIAKQYEKEYPDVIRAIDKPNGNYGSTINKGIELASGKFFRILDSDDFYDNSGLNKLMAELDSLDVDLVLTNYRRDRGNQKAYFDSPKKYCNKQMFFDDVNLNDFPNFAMHAITYKTSILKNNNIRLQEGISYTDSEFCFYPLPFIKTFIALDILVYCYQLGRIGQTVDIRSQIKSVNHMYMIADRMHLSLKNMDEKLSIFEKQRKIFITVSGLCFLTILCFDKSDRNLSLAKELNKKIENISGASSIMMKANLFKIRYYKRFILKGKASHNIWYSMYYNIIKKLSILYWKIRELKR